MSRRKRVKNPAKSSKFDQSNEVRAIARERVGPVKPSQPILSKTARKKPKHKKLFDQE
jgi:hypothetical protein